jgi:heptosyltransferase-3
MMRSWLKSLEHAVKRLVFAVSRIYLKKGRQGFQTIDPPRLRRVLFIRPEKLGDMIISLPVFHNLKKLYPHQELYTKRFLRDLAMVRRVRRLGVDAVVDMVCDDSVTSLFLTQYSSPRAWRIGLGKTRHRAYYDFNYEYRTQDEAHVLENTLKLLTAFGIDTDGLERHVPPTIDDRSYQAADRFLLSLNGAVPNGVIGLNISAGRPTRVWPDTKNRTLIERMLVAYPHHRVVISADPADRPRALALAALFPERVDPLPDGLNLLDVSAIISRMKMLVTPDTSLVHIARSFRVPVVGLYTRYARNFILWRPFGQAGGAVISGNDYNIHDIAVDDVFNAVMALLPPGGKS